LQAQLQLDIARNADEHDALGAYTPDRFDTRDVNRDEIRQVQQQGACVEAGAKQLRHLRSGKPARQPDDTPLTVLDDANPAIHDQSSRQDGAAPASSMVDDGPHDDRATANGIPLARRA
jgi:uncharacterized protein YdeI (YjbR/CyaY-like superfamily)